MSISFVQVTSQTQTNSAPPFTNPNAAGNCIVVFVAAFNTGGGGTPITVTDTQGNTYVAVGGIQIGANSGNYSQVIVAANIIGGAANTVSYSPTGFGTLKNIMAVEYSGASKTSPVRSEDSSYSGGAGTKTVNLNSHVADLVVLFTLEMQDTFTTPPAGFTTRVASGALPPNVANLYDGPASGAGVNPYAVVDTDAAGGTVWGVVLMPLANKGYSYAFEC
jgi:hypothetical protein